MAGMVTGILLAAGLSERMGQDKLLLRYRGKTLLSRAVNLLVELPLQQRILVTTAARVERVKVPPAVEVVVNAHPERGQSFSLRLGLERAKGDHYLFLTADQPLLNAEEVERLLRQADGEHIVYPMAGGIPRSPVLFPARFRQELMALEGDTGGRAVRAAHPGSCLPLEAEHAAPYLDIDTEEDYNRLI